MKRTRLTIAVVLLAVAAHPFAQVRAEVALRAAMEKETVDGDLKGAIAAYQKIVDGYRDDRAVRALALLRMAGCYQKLGDAQAKQIYERVIAEYSDQRDAVALARAHLKPPPQEDSGAALTIRRVYSDPEDVETISPDGLSVALTDWNTGNLVIREIGNGKERRLTDQRADPYSEFGEKPVFSRDGRQVAFTWCTAIPKPTPEAPPRCHGFLRIARIARRGEPSAAAPRVVYNKEVWTQAFDWTSDGRWIAVAIEKADKSKHVGVFSVGDGEVTVLSSLEGHWPRRMFFSPHGSYLAFDTGTRQQGQLGGKSDVFVIDIRTAKRQTLAGGPGHDLLAGWSPDGRQVLFTSDISGSTDLYASRLLAPGAPPVRIRTNMGSITPMQLTPAGKLYYSMITGGGSDIQSAAFDFRRGQFISPPRNAVEEFAGANSMPRWSPDGKWLSFMSRRGAGYNQTVVLVFRSLASSESREIRPSIAGLQQVQWVDSGSLVGIGDHPEGSGHGLFLIDAATGSSTVLTRANEGTLLQLRVASQGKLHYFRIAPATTTKRFMELDIASRKETELLAIKGDVPASAQLSPGGGKVYYRRPQPTATAPVPASVIVERDVVTGAERELLQGRFGLMTISPDGQYIAIPRNDPAGKWRSIVLLPTNGEPARDLMKVEQTAGINFGAWAPDSRSVLITKPNADPKKAETWWVPIEGGAPQRLPHYLSAGIAIHPDGRHIAVQVGGEAPRRFEIWAMEHFLPAPKESGLRP